MKGFICFFVDIMMLVLMDSVYGQICRIDSIIINNIIETEKTNIIEEGFGEGPFITGQCVVVNNTNETLYLNTNVEIVFVYQNNSYNKNVSFNLNKQFLILEPLDSTIIQFGTTMMLDVLLDKSKKTISDSMTIINHSTILKDILDSICVYLFFSDKTIGIKPSSFIIKDPVAFDF